jgi:hypothetical protein
VIVEDDVLFFIFIFTGKEKDYLTVEKKRIKKKTLQKKNKQQN